MKVSVFGGDKKFTSLIKELSEAKFFDEIGDAIAYAKNEAGALFLLPLYDKGEYSIPEFSDEVATALCEVIKSGKTRVYIENYPAYDYRDCFVLGLQARSLLNNIGKLSVCISEGYRERLGFEILQKRYGFYYPSAIHTDEKVEVIAEIKNCLGVHKIIDGAERDGVALLRTERGVYCAMADLTRLKDNEIFSYKHWKDFWKMLISEIIDTSKDAVDAAFSATYEKIGIRKEVRESDTARALVSAVKNAVEWHRRSGIMKDEGKRGVYEMIRSFDLTVSKNLRGDSALFTAALFEAAGRYFNDEGYSKIADNIVSAMLSKEELQIKMGENRGLFKWFSGISNMGARSVYVSDSSRVGNSVYALYKLSGKEEYKEAIISLGDALLRWFGKEALLPGCQFNYEKDDLNTIQKRKRYACPEFYDAPLLFLGNLYSVTHDERYKEQVIKTAKCLAELYPNYEVTTSHSDNFTFSRLLGALSAAQRFGDGAWTPVIDELLRYFSKLQHTAGGFRDGKAYFDKESIKKDMEFAVGFGLDDSIADVVYCQNTLACALTVLLSADGSFDRGLAEKMRDSLVDFLLDIQIRSSDERFNGVWMRAFDMDNMEYYGCDKDFAWGPYCILTGWVTGAIPLVFLDILGLKTMY